MRSTAEPGPGRVAVAVSGGRDSTALLHCTVRAAELLGVEVSALHVHHGLAPQADDWQALVRSQSRRWGAGFDSRRAEGSPARGDSIEAWARGERYRLLAEMAEGRGCTLVLLAHHRRDQAETVLLQALRSGAPAGLAAMPKVAQRGGITWARPWLALPREAIEAYVRRHRLRHIDDASNVDPRFGRGRLRREAWPALAGAFPQAEAALAAVAVRAAESALLAAEAAAVDLPPIVSGTALMRTQWLALPEARRRNALRAWLAERIAAGIPETLVQRLMQEVPRLHHGRWPAPRGELVLRRGRLEHAP